MCSRRTNKRSSSDKKSTNREYRWSQRIDKINCLATLAAQLLSGLGACRGREEDPKNDVADGSAQYPQEKSPM